MDRETQSRIFEPFFSTKPHDKGTGLGLSTILGIVEQCGGTIAVHSEPGAGTTFEIRFPRCGETPAVPQMRKAQPVEGGTETVLLVDDSAPLRRLMRLFLADSGYTVLESGDPAEALRMAAEHPGPVPLMITDVVLPGFSGHVLAEKAATVRPGIKVLYVSGYSGDLITPSPVAGQEYACLAKPFTRKDLLEKVRRLLDSSIELPVPPQRQRPVAGDQG
jgi:CheY-like chemotaxis protein